jgi:hypothetical protein
LAKAHWLEGESGLAEESGEQCRVVLQPLEPGLHQGDELVDASGGAVAQAALEVRPNPSVGLNSGA